MISGQIDELRNAAEFYDGFQAANLMRDAADTICELRDDLQRANAAVQDAEHDESMAWDRVRKAEADNAKLQEQIHWLKQGDILHVLTDQEYIDQCERERLMQVSIDALDKENAKLRELVADAWGYISHPANATWTHEKRKEVRHSLSDRMRELGVEVDA